jgi:hypothetical protein
MLKNRKAKKMKANKRLYFIPIIAQALNSDDPKRAMEEAFSEIRELGNQSEYAEGFRQFLEFVEVAVKPSAKDSKERVQIVKNAIYRLIYDLATDTFDGDEEQKNALLNAFRSIPEWKAEYERIKEEAQAFQAPETPMEVEVLKDDRIIGSSVLSAKATFISSIRPGSYTIRFSNGRVLWEGVISPKDVIWAFAYPDKDLPMAAETEPPQREPTRTLNLLNGELIIQVFAGLESGEIRLKSG